MTRKKSIEILQAALAGQKDKAAYLLHHAEDPETACYILSFDKVTAVGNRKVLTAEELKHEIAEAKRFGIECVEIDFSKAL
ncbi:hypothetical protein DC498_17635 [Terrimonas sp.]|uniref:hypothetical protein n=1 Tax=Terrimonas sp. TaxID=1914338 RepID=UPI000D52092B|nr:hypothetical protein [Terrimonas sp.]PVD50794.1 hypothetical protein DC498_17635 [Terrimonas sp.]